MLECSSMCVQRSVTQLGGSKVVGLAELSLIEGQQTALIVALQTEASYSASAALASEC
jgi:hypothetical protein